MAQKHTINDIEKPMTTYGPEQGPNKRYRRLRHPAFPAATWTDNNPLLQKGEIGAETDTHKAKIGDGVTYWNDLPYITAVGQPLSTADYQMGNALGGWTTMTTAQQDALNSGATTTNIGQIATNTANIANKVNIDGTSIMTAPLKFMSGSMRGAVGPYLNGVGFWKLDSDANLTLIATLSDSQFIPTTTGAISLGSSAKRFKDLYIGGTGSTIDIDGSTVWFKGYFNLKNQNQTNSLCWHAGSTSNRYAWGLNSDINNVGFQYDSSLRSFMPLIDKAESLGSASFMWKNVYTPKINNGADITVPTSGGTMALMSDVELAANSGSQLYSTGVWYAKMYSATTVPTGAEYDGTNYADFSQVDGDNNPIIVIYEGQSGAWVQIDTITPPATYNGYITVTSKIWDIVEQTDQQGGQVLWSFNQKTFTPYPRIVSVAGFANTDLSNLSATGEARFTAKANTDLSNLTATGEKKFSDTVLNLLEALYPVDSIYIGTQSTCPLATLIPGSTWELVQGRYLLASGTLVGTSETYVAKNTVAAGLPNIKGQWTTGWGGHYIPTINVSGAVSTVSSYSYEMANSPGSQQTQPFTATFNASWSNPIYSSSATVRPPAYVVNVWRRTA